MNKIRNTLIIAVIVAAVAAFALTACANQQVDESDSASNSVQSLSTEKVSDVASKSVESSSASAEPDTTVDEQAEESNESDSETISDVESYEYEYDYEIDYNDGYSGSEGASYSPAYGENGPTRDMPGWYDGHIETYYSSNTLYHYRTDEWTTDSEGFYRDDNGYYVVGVGINDGYQLGDIIDTGKGKAIVSDFGTATNDVDFYTNW